MKKISILLLISFFSLSGFTQDSISVYQAQDSLFLVGDRTFSLFYITPSGVIVIDPISERISQATMNVIRKHSDLPVTYVFYSHNHWDHTSGGKIYKDQGATIVAHEEAAASITPNPKVIMPDSTWSGEQTIFNPGENAIELYYYGPNHGKGMTVFRFPKYNAVFSIDLVVPDRVLYAYLPDAKPENWLQSLYKMQALEFDQLLMAHVRPIGTRKDLNLQIQYFEDLYAAVDKAMNDGTPFFDIPQKVKLPQYEHLLNYKEWLHMNVWRILMEKSIGQ